MVTIKKACRAIVAPITEEFPLFISIIILIGYPIVVNFIDGITRFSFIIRASRYLGMAMVIAYILTSMVYLSKSKIIKGIVYMALILLSLTDIFLRISFGHIMSPTIFMLIGETGQKETAEFFSTFLCSFHGFTIVLLLILIFSAIVLFEKNKKNISHKLTHIDNKQKIIVCLLGIYLFGAGAWKMRIYYTLLNSPTRMEMEDWATSNRSGMCTDLITCTVYSAVGAHILHQELITAKQTAQKVQTSAISTDADSDLTVIYVLGESFIKYHSSLYGYYNETNPILKKEQAMGHLYVFNDAVTPFNTTSFTMKNTLSCNRLAAKENWSDFPFFPTLFKHAGYNVFFWDIQKTYDQHEMYTLSINSLLYDKKMAEATYTEVSKAQPFNYDGQLVADFFSKPRATQGRNLLMFHLLGQHVDTHKRYPHTAAFKRFAAKDIKSRQNYLDEDMKEDIAHYDNATLYNDYVLGKIIEKYRKSNCILVYYSDHGEEVYDYRPSLGRKNTPVCANLLKYQFDIPFMIWCSDSYKKQHPEVIKNIAASLDKPLFTDDVPHLMMGIGGIKSPYYHHERNILSPSYRPAERVVNEHIHYDRIRWSDSATQE